MPFESIHRPLEIPECNILSFLFPDANARQEELWTDAENDSKSLSADAALLLIRRVAQGFDNMGIPPDSSILLISPNHIYVPILYLAVAGSGRVYTAANPVYTVDELIHGIKTVRPAIILAHPDDMDNALKAASQAGVPNRKVFSFSDAPATSLPKGVQDWSTILASEDIAESWQWPALEGAASRNTIAVINFSSGTTGLPKGVTVTHHNIVANAMQDIHARFLEKPHVKSDRWLTFLPCSIEERCAKRCCGEARRYYLIVQSWGMSETTCTGLMIPGTMKDDTGSVGYLLPNTSAMLVDENEKEVIDPEASGELWVRGPQIMKAYLNNASATSETLTADGWLKTGDVALQKDGKWWIVDRRKELIKVNGFQVAPAELEALLYQNTDVVDAAVVGIMRHGEELPRAYVVLSKDAKKNPKAAVAGIQEFVTGKVVKHKRLQGGVICVSEIPRLMSGKIKRKVIKEWAREDEKVLDQKTRAKL